MMRFVREGDSVIVESISRFARNTKGFRVIKRASSLEEAQMCAFNHALEQKQPHKIPRDIGLDQMVLFRFYPEIIEPMEFE